ncbi:pseudouridine synthase [Desulfobotulus mexicanus]|uniref:pseudouridine synthase n=1 Tax=Desulfobotulus mexicanus TaxID=2586642 RepID=UPI0015D3E8AC|nr:pseudouridine synthase [Desulfobotulus mexicanus]
MEAESEQIKIIYKDEELVAVHKPSGMPVHRGGRESASCTALLQTLRDMLGRHVYPVHRLDRPTSGILVMALTPEAASNLGGQFRRHEVDKAYLALVRGQIPLRGVLSRFLRPEDEKNGLLRFSITRYHRADCVEIPVPMGRVPSRCYSLVELHPETGRSRQIRRHLKSFSHPIIGDTTYGDGRHNRFFREAFDCQRLMLAATLISFLHPHSGHRLHLSVPPSADFCRVLVQLGMEADWAQD